MWIPKWKRDEKNGVDSPVPTQVLSNEEFIPRPQNKKQKQWESLISEMSTENAKQLGMDRRDFTRSSMGMATAFLASNMIYGPCWDVSAEETLDEAARLAVQGARPLQYNGYKLALTRNLVKRAIRDASA